LAIVFTAVASVAQPAAHIVELDVVTLVVAPINLPKLSSRIIPQAY